MFLILFIGFLTSRTANYVAEAATAGLSQPSFTEAIGSSLATQPSFTEAATAGLAYAQPSFTEAVGSSLAQEAGLVERGWIVKWQNYKRNYPEGTSLPVPTDESFSTYVANMQRFQHHNSLASTSSSKMAMRLGNGVFSHLTHEQFLGLTEQAQKWVKLHRPPTAIIPLPGLTRFPLVQPDRFDWRNDTRDVITNVGSQGSCGSCWAFSAVNTLYACLKIKGGMPTLGKLSIQQLLDCSDAQGNTGCLGGWAHQAVTYVKVNKGINSAANYPYIGVDQPCDTTKAKVKVGSATGYTSLPVNNPNAMYSSIISRPLIITLDGSSDLFQNYAGGIITNATACGIEMNHQITLVGYDVDPVLGPYWIAKNQWSTSWGDQGYVYLQRDVVTGVGVCGINQWTIYANC